MHKVRRALVVGGGIAGMAAAIGLRQAGVDVDLIDIDPNWKVYGAGITITGPTLRVMKQIGILDDVVREGFTADGLLACDPEGRRIAEIGTEVTHTDPIPGAGGILRPTLHRILAARTKAAGPRIALGRAVKAIAAEPPHEVTFDDGETASYDLVIGADGIFSSVRAMAFPHEPPPRYVGQICWRLMTGRLPEIERRTYFLGGPSKVGLNPVSPDEMYMFLLEPVSEVRRHAPAEQVERLRELLSPFGGPLARVREELGPQSRIVTRPLETVFVSEPWFQDGILLVGDAAHATTPQLASGAGMAMEDGVVLGEAIAAANGDLPAALGNFMSRRFARCAFVVEKSLALGRMEREGAGALEQVRAVEEALLELNRPY
jgi:2-polyprenyl-6-methoxyphenol hydroxylase-like FAD-dependent oxidoreductase